MPPKRRASSREPAARRGSSASRRGSSPRSPSGSRRGSPAPSGRSKEIMDELMASGESEGFALGVVRTLDKDSRWNGTDVIVKDERGNDFSLVEDAGLKTWAATSISDQKTQIRCPAPGCSHVLWDHDVKALVSEEMFKNYTEFKQADHAKKLKEDLKDKELGAWLKMHARPCPDCHIVVSRSEGCNMMMCVCGCKFMYCCGFKTCQCGKASKPDIWNPP